MAELLKDKHECLLYLAGYTAKKWTCPDCGRKWKHVQTKVTTGYIPYYRGEWKEDK